MIIPQHIPHIVQLSTRLNPISRRFPKELPLTETKISFQPETILYYPNPIKGELFIHSVIVVSFMPVNNLFTTNRTSTQQT